MQTPLQRALEEYIRADWARFHMPGHKGAALEPFGGLMAYDVTEVEGTDSLFEDDGPLRELEDWFTELYGTSRTVLSAGGSTLCIQAMLKLVARPGGVVLAGRNIHNAAVNAMALLGLEPVWLYPQREGERLIGRIAPETLARALKEHPDACAVYLTSPDYFGVMQDLPALSALCHQAGVPLLVDNAHGAHLKFLQPSLHPMDLGADLCCDSLHKTLPALTGGALLHCRRPQWVPRLKESMTVFGSTSPNYLIMLSCDRTAGFLREDGPRRLQETAERCSQLRQLARERGFSVPEHSDPMRLTLTLAGTQFDKESFRPLLREHGIMEEFLSDSGCVLLLSPFNREEDFARVERLLRSVTVEPRPVTPWPMLYPQKACSLREALLAPRETLPIEQCAGRVAAQVKSPCPPGIPLVVPGERLQENEIKTLKSYGIYTMDVIK